MSVPARVVHMRRATITALPLYYSGPLLKKLCSETDYKKFYAELRGDALFLYKDETQDTYTEKLNLQEMKSMHLESPYERKMPTVFTLTLATQKVHLKMDNPDTGEEWRVYIQTMVQKEIPSQLQLLPGQKMLLEDALSQEQGRKALANTPPALPPRPAYLRGPSASPPPPDHSSPEQLPCFFNVTRQEAEQMLEQNPEYGSIILRPSALAKNYALTLRQVTASGPVMRNYRLTCTKSGFIIQLETSVIVSSLSDVLEYFLEKTEYRLHPYTPCETYNTFIEMTPPPERVTIPSRAAKSVPKAEVGPMVCSGTKPGEGEYVVPEEHQLNKKKGVNERI
ncbi:signal-transducing adaptor protein 1-like isoform X2 [Entelurus aequoreus]|uniref:signal-transducing adaptor protein 1-like isoform X2 n=1 Tax=Entelurus aequoreus TaxID=161455 RepID=UPI002B1DFD9E|nr:signal-transducing adaptor protein 1-like isoform X2 [Entelurus aequoreus]